MRYNNKIETLVAELENNDLIQVVNSRIGGNAPSDFLNKMQDYHKVKVFKDIIDMYSEMTSCKIEWQCDLSIHDHIKKFSPDDEMVSGYIEIRPIEKFLAYDDRLNANWWVEHLEEDEATDLKKFRYLDFNDDYTRVGFIINEKEAIEDELFMLHQNAEGFYPAGMDFNKYFDAIIKYKGFQGFQYNMFFPDTDNAKRMSFYLEQLFK